MNKYLLAVAFQVICISVRAQDHVLLSEVGLGPDANEFVEIYNPTTSAISLDNYYLSDNMEYSKLPTGAVPAFATDWTIRFPAGAMIQPGQALVIARSADNFYLQNGVYPDYEYYGTNATVPNMDSVMMIGSPSITNAGEAIILFYWDGIADLVTDVDMLNAGVPAAMNQITPKTGIAQDGPDDGVDSSTYLYDANTIPLQPTTPLLGQSTKRIFFEEGYEVLSGGNGITGHDETTENTLVTWDTIYSAPTPGSVSIVLGVNSISKNNVRLRIYPNPVAKGNSFSVLFSEEAPNAGYRISICDMTGREVHRKQIRGNQVIVSKHELVPGMYYVNCRTAEGHIIGIEKLIID